MCQQPGVQPGNNFENSRFDVRTHAPVNASLYRLRYGIRSSLLLSQYIACYLNIFQLLQLYAESVALFQGGSPYIYPLYGLGELPQVNAFKYFYHMVLTIINVISI